MTTPKFHPRVICYARVSTEEQGTDEHFSIEAQLNEMQEFAKRRGWEIIAQFIDTITGPCRDCPQLEAALEMIRQCECNILLVHKLDHLRSVLTLDTLRMVAQNNARIISVKEADFDFTRLLQSPSLIQSKRQRAQDGLHNASVAPYGYAKGGDPHAPLHTVDEEAVAVRLMFELYATGAYSDQAIADMLNERGYRTRKGHPFTASTVADALRNPFYIGKVAYRRKHAKYDELYDGAHEPLVSQELWERCQEVRAQRHSASRAMQKPFRVYLLGYLAHCSVCGRRLGGQPTTSGLYYREVSRVRGHNDCPHHSRGIRVEIPDRQISAIVTTIQLPPDWQEELKAQVGGDEQLFYPPPAAVTAKTLPELWAHTSPEDQRDLLRMILREVRVDVTTGRVVSLCPQSVFIPIFREMPLLDERDLGVFVPNWGGHPDADSILAIPRLPTIETTPVAMDAAPLWASLPIAGKENARIAPGITEALRMCAHAPTHVTQVCWAGQTPLPDDLRKWGNASARVVTPEEWRTLDDASTDVLVTRLGLWRHTLGASQLDLDALITEAHRVLHAGGVWYWVEILPLEIPAHWIFRIFPPMWEWARVHTPTMYALNVKLLEAGFTTRMKHHVCFQPIRADVALAIAERRAGLLAQLSDAAYAEGITRLKQLVADKGATHTLGSEVGYVEVWAGK